MELCLSKLGFIPNANDKGRNRTDRMPEGACIVVIASIAEDDELSMIIECLKVV